jgi:hypothetical protein
MTFDDIVVKQAPSRIPGFFFKFDINFLSASQFIFDLFNFTYPGEYPSLYYDGIDVKILGARYSDAGLNAFGAWASQVLSGTGPFTMGVYVKGDPDGNNCQMAAKIWDGVTEYASGWVAISGQNLGQVLLNSNQYGSGDFEIGTLTGFDSASDAEVDAQYAIPLNGPIPVVPIEVDAVEFKVPGMLEHHRTAIPSDVDELNAVFTEKSGQRFYANAFMVADDNVNIAMVMHDGTEQSFQNINHGYWRKSEPFKQIKATGTTVASLKIGLCH